VRARGQPAQRATAPTAAGPATPLYPPAAPSGPKPAADDAPTSVSDTSPPSAHVETFAVKPTAAPLSSATTDDTTSSIPEVPAPQASTFSETSAQTAAPAPNAEPLAWPDTGPRIKAQGPTNASSAASASDYAERIIRSREQNKNAGMPMIIFFIIALGLAVVGILSRVVIKNIKNASARRARIVIGYPGPNKI
jgi:hypothetical protein